MKTVRMLILPLAIWVLILSGNGSPTLGQTAHERMRVCMESGTQQQQQEQQRKVQEQKDQPSLENKIKGNNQYELGTNEKNKIRKFPSGPPRSEKVPAPAPSYVEVKNNEVQICKLEEKIKYIAGPGVDEKLAQQLVGSWTSRDGYSTLMEIEATGAKVQGSLFLRGPDPDTIKYLLKFDAVVEKSRLIGTTKWNPGSPDSGQTPLNSEINLSPDGRSLTLNFGGLSTTLHRK